MRSCALQKSFPATAQSPERRSCSFGQFLRYVSRPLSMERSRGEKTGVTPARKNFSFTLLPLTSSHPKLQKNLETFNALIWFLFCHCHCNGILSQQSSFDGAHPSKTSLLHLSIISMRSIFIMRRHFSWVS